jgi:hypothetical protein
VTARKVAAGLIVAAVCPLMADVASDPYSDRSVAQSWLRGALILTVAGGLSWAVNELAADS